MAVPATKSTTNSRKTDAAFADFLKRYPVYAKTKHLDALRTKDYDGPRAKSEIYLDYTGGGQFGLSQLKQHVKLLERTLYGNPHSDNPTSSRSTELSEIARKSVLDFFNASSKDYCVIFTPNASGALRVVGESYPFEKGSRYVMFADDHNSVLGIREYAKAKGAKIGTIASKAPELQVDPAEVTKELKDHTAKPHLFAYPAQSNFSGVQHSLEFIELAHEEGWDVLLDAAAFVPTNKLDLKKYHPDFVSLSFYKMFGWPTGVGCLLARKSTLEKLCKPWFAGGTIWAASAQGGWYVLAPEHEGFEDGTINYLNLPAITIGLDYLKQADINSVHSRVMCLTGWTLEQLQALRHDDGRPATAIYGPLNTKNRGGTIAFNFLDPNGQVIDERVIEVAAKKRGISLRAGCFCNPGSGEVAFHLDANHLRTMHPTRDTDFDEQLHLLGMQSGGAIRVSLGLFTNFNDAAQFMEFAQSFLNKIPGTSKLQPRKHC